MVDRFHLSTRIRFRILGAAPIAALLLGGCGSGSSAPSACPATAPVACFDDAGTPTGCCATACGANGACLATGGGSGGGSSFDAATGGSAGAAQGGSAGVAGAGAGGSAGAGGASGSGGGGGTVPGGGSGGANTGGSGGTVASGGAGGGGTSGGGNGGTGGASSGGTGGVSSGGTGGVSSGGTGGGSGGSGGGSSGGGTGGGSGGSCGDLNEPNDSEASATTLGTIDDCDSSGKTLNATLANANDADHYSFAGTDVSWCVVDPTASTPSAVRLCMFASCGSAPVLCVSGTSTIAGDGTQGCCTGPSGGTVQLQLFCNSKPANVMMRVDQGGASCASYGVTYHY